MTDPQPRLICFIALLFPLFSESELPARPARDLFVPAAGRAGFALLPPASTGITFTNHLSADRHLTNQILLNGSGVAAGDIDGDGWCDLYFCGLDGPNKLYRNLGQWKFQEVTDSAGVACADLDCTGTAFADLDGDGDLDLVVNSLGGGTHLFLNDGKGRFSEPMETSPLNRGLGATSLAFADVDGDGDLDLYIANYRTVTIRDQPNTKFSFRVVDGKPQVTTVNGRSIAEPDLANRFTFHIRLGETSGSFGYDENGEPDALCLNDGTGGFTPVSFTGGAFLDESGQPLKAPPFDWGLSAMFHDLNGDGAPDLYVCNDFRSPDRIWINDGKGRFRMIAPLAIRQTCLSGMGVDIADINRDGYDDIFTVDMLSLEHQRRFSQRIDIKPEQLPIGAITNRPQYTRNMLHLGRGDGTFAEIAQLSGLEAGEWAWMPIFLDVDLDGYEDVLIPNGFERDNMNVDALRTLETAKKQQRLTPQEMLRLRKSFPRLDTPNLAFRNLGNLQFTNTSDAWGFNTPVISQGAVLADLDNDGDLDVAANNLNTVAGVYRNESNAPRVAVRLKGLPPNTRGVGARIRCLGGAVPLQSQELKAGGRYLSSDDPVRVFACGRTTGGMTLEVNWRSGKRSVVHDVRPNRLYEIDESAAAGKVAPPPAAPAPFFKDASTLLGHTHHEDPFDDFALQPMLPHRLSQLGPGVSWFDVDGDGWDDLVIGSGRGGQMAVFRNHGQGGLAPLTNPLLGQTVTRDQTAVLGWRPAGAKSILIAGSANYEDGLTNGSVARLWDLTGGQVQDALPGSEASTGPLAMADIDGDGDLDLFVGGRVIAGRCAAPASSSIFRAGADNRLAFDSAASSPFTKVGLVSGAVFSDLNADGRPDLVLACQWGPVRVFRNQQGKFTEVTAALGLDRYSGWWSGVATGDFDGDGRLDIVAANWGRNSKYEFFRHQPLELVCADVDGNGTMEYIEAYHSPALKRLAPVQPYHVASAAVPFLLERAATCGAYAAMGIEGLYGDALKSASRFQAGWLESTVFLNRGDHFEARSLPVEAQFSPAFAACVADFDGDGALDVFLGQNLFAVQIDTSRYDAGRGLWLRGDGQGNFRSVAGQESGVSVYGEQRGAAVGDYDSDGRVDLVVTQNAGETKLYHNVGAKPGLRVRLAGPPGNPQGVGALVRLGTQGRLGPAREIQAGSGYWSQDSAVLVMCSPAPPTNIWIRWPGGRPLTGDIPPGSLEITMDQEGNVKRTR